MRIMARQIQGQYYVKSRKFQTVSITDQFYVHMGRDTCYTHTGHILLVWIRVCRKGG
jgi:hypothetical protein